MALPYRLDRTVTIRASRDTVFSFFTDSSRWASWWGAGSTIEARPGGPVYIRHPGGVESRGEVLEVDAPERLVFTYGFVGGTPMPPGSSRVTIRLEARPDGTALFLEHEFPDEAARDEHIQGWRFQLALFGNVVADLANAGAARLVDAWFAAWAEPDAIARERQVAAIAAGTVEFRDRFSLLDGMADLLPHIAAAQRFMPGMRLERSGEVRHCQGMVLADWVARGADGAEQGSGTNVFALGGDGKIQAVTGFWTASAR